MCFKQRVKEWKKDYLHTKIFTSTQNAHCYKNRLWERREPSTLVRLWSALCSYYTVMLKVTVALFPLKKRVLTLEQDFLLFKSCSCPVWPFCSYFTWHLSGKYRPHWYSATPKESIPSWFVCFFAKNFHALKSRLCLLLSPKEQIFEWEGVWPKAPMRRCSYSI